jgi:phosphoribosylanthranilate isomerase
MVRIKICGITNHEDASMAVRMGVEAIGFIFAQSPRRIDPEMAREIIDGLPPFTRTVGVFVNEAPETIKEIIRFCALDLVQLHGDESPDICARLMPHTIKSFRIKDESSLNVLESYVGKVRAFLFDTYAEEKWGGTGKIFDWDLAIKGKNPGVPVILSGGLDPSNIQAAISTVQPYAVDVNSGIEERPGKKDPVLLKRLMENIKNAST